MTKLTFLVIPFATGILVAQTPTFEVASVRINSSGDLSRSVRALPGGRLEATNAPLRNLVRYAYELRTLGEIEGGPNWMDSAAFDIRATGTPDGLQPQMLQALLSERFKLLARREMRERPVYALTVARADRRLGRSITAGSIKCAATTTQWTNPARNHEPSDLTAGQLAWRTAGADGDRPHRPGWQLRHHPRVFVRAAARRSRTRTAGPQSSFCLHGSAGTTGPQARSEPWIRPGVGRRARGDADRKLNTAFQRV